MDEKDFLKKIEIELKISKNSEYTVRNYINSNKNLIKFANKIPSNISEDDVKFYISENLSDQAATSIILFLSAVKYAYLNILKEDITKGIKRPKREKKNPTVLTKDEIRRLLDSIETKKSKLMVSLMYACGMRVSELISLKLVDLDFEEKIGHIRQAKGKRDRVFNIPNFLAYKLKIQSEKQKENNQEFLFTGPKGKLSSRNLQKIVSKYSKKADIKKDVHCHTLRHSFSTHLQKDYVFLIIALDLFFHSKILQKFLQSQCNFAQEIVFLFQLYIQKALGTLNFP